MKIIAIQSGIRTFPPASFGLVMSTGIISIASHFLQYETVSNLLFVINNIAYMVLLALLIAHIISYRKDFLHNLSSHEKGAGFLTIVAGSDILGTQYILLRSNHYIAIALLVIGICSWLVFIYSFFILTTIRKNKPSPETGLNGSWLLFVVATQSLSILASNIIKPYISIGSNAIIFLSFGAFLLGIMFYIILISIIFYRTTFYEMKPEEFQPSYWIDMGAAAITVLAGVLLIKNFTARVDYLPFTPVIKTLCLLFWAISSWWLPAIFILEIWRHKTIPYRYQAGYWSMVFPLGMYTVCTWQFADIFNVVFLKTIAQYFIFVAWLGWIFIFISMLMQIFRQARSQVLNYQ